MNKSIIIPVKYETSNKKQNNGSNNNISLNETEKINRFYGPLRI